MTIRIALADDHFVVREGLKALLNGCEAFQVNAEIDTIDALRAFDFTDFDVLVLDLSFRGENALPLIRGLCTRFPTLRILILSVFAETQYALKGFESGATGYLTKDAAGDELIAAVQQVARGERFLSGGAPPMALNPADDELARVQRTLSGREFEVFLLIGEAVSTFEIADRLALNPKTVSTYKKRIIEKLNVASRGHLVKLAMRCRPGS